ncbi:sigma factor-like helix-turn-helix DNA-binding protein, partial [Paraburkholderia sp. SIMBA_061]
DLTQRSEPPAGEARLALIAVMNAMEALSDEHQAMLLMICVEGLSYREAAAALDLPIGTVMSRLSRARMALSEALEKRRPLLNPAGGTA